MKRTPSRRAQLTFDLAQEARALPWEGSLAGRLTKRICRRIAEGLVRSGGRGHLVSAKVNGRTLLMPAEHPIVPVLADHPQFNRPLALSMEAIAERRPERRPLAVIDVGANIGETIAIIDERVPGSCEYLCLEADAELAELCRRNYTAELASGRVQVEQAFVGEAEGAAVRLEDDGRANPSTRLTTEVVGQSSGGRLVRLDTVARSFAEAHGGVDLIKVDTEGYDFTILRSGRELLQAWRPAVYFEWFPELLEGLNETVWGGFEHLAELGYRHFAFFTHEGDFYCKVSEPDRLFLRSLAHGALRPRSGTYFDVFATADEGLRDRLVELSVEANNPDTQRCETPGASVLQ